MIRLVINIRLAHLYFILVPRSCRGSSMSNQAFMNPPPSPLSLSSLWRFCLCLGRSVSSTGPLHSHMMTSLAIIEERQESEDESVVRGTSEVAPVAAAVRPLNDRTSSLHSAHYRYTSTLSGAKHARSDPISHAERCATLSVRGVFPRTTAVLGRSSN